jgi:hypothetical protein
MTQIVSRYIKERAPIIAAASKATTPDFTVEIANKAATPTQNCGRRGPTSKIAERIISSRLRASHVIVATPKIALAPKLILVHAAEANIKKSKLKHQ